MTTQAFPAWFYGPGGTARVFQSAEEVPAGWHDHPSKIGEKAPAPIDGDTPAADGTVDAGGWPFDAELHAATKSLTQGGLWRMKVGKTRPAAKPGFPKPTLDL